MLTNGPFMLSRWSHGEYLVIKKHEGYHDQESILPAAVRYVIGQVEDPVTSLAEGNLDAAEISPSQVEAAREENLQLVPLEDTISYLWMNNTAKGLKKEETRRALREALQWDALTALIGEAGFTVATGYTAPAGGAPRRGAVPHRGQRLGSRDSRRRHCHRRPGPAASSGGDGGRRPDHPAENDAAVRGR